MEKGAFFSADRRYRYVLWRTWDLTRPVVLFIGLNPSTADEKNDDPTVRKCMGFARRWGCGGLIFVNLFAYRTTNPINLRKVVDPVGLENDCWIQNQLGKADFVVGAWGNHGSYMGRGARYLEEIPELYCLQINKTGHPAHPLYISYEKDLRKLNVDKI